MLTRSAGPDGCFTIGEVRDVSTEEAKVLVDGGFAEKIKVAEPKKPDKKKKNK